MNGAVPEQPSHWRQNCKTLLLFQLSVLSYSSLSSGWLQEADRTEVKGRVAKLSWNQDNSVFKIESRKAKISQINYDMSFDNFQRAR